MFAKVTSIHPRDTKLVGGLDLPMPLWITPSESLCSGVSDLRTLSQWAPMSLHKPSADLGEKVVGANLQLSLSSHTPHGLVGGMFHGPTGCIRPPPGLELELPMWILDSASEASSPSADTTAPSSSPSESVFSSESEVQVPPLQRTQQPTLHSHGAQESVGSRFHTSGACTPCAFYCFKAQGCGMGAECNYCHMDHISNKKLRQQEWRKKQQVQKKKQRRNHQGIPTLTDSAEENTPAGGVTSTWAVQVVSM